MSVRALQLAARHLKLDQMPDKQRERLRIFQSSLTYRDDRLAGLDAAVLMEVIEHLDPERIPALERVVFGFAAPATVVVTTPNAEYNVHFIATLAPGAMRHRDHRFEWTRAEFRGLGRASRRQPTATRSASCPSAPNTPTPARPPSWPSSPGARTGNAGRPAMTELKIPELSLVVLVGITGAGKSTFARTHFKPTEVISSDFCRGLVADDENDQSATPAAFDVLHYIAGQRLAAGRLTVIDATNVQPEARRELVMLAREHDVLPVAIVLDLPEKLCAERNVDRPDRDFGAHVLRRQRGQLRRGLHSLHREGFRTVHMLRTPDEIAAATITRTRLYSDLKHESGPFDVIGDVHGCRAELEQLLTELGYTLEHDAAGRPVGARHPDGRRAVFVGDLVDRGPDTPGVLRLVMGMVAAGTAFCVAGNHEVKLRKALRGKNVRRSHGLDASMEQLEPQSEEFRAQVDRFIDGLISHYVLDGGRLVVAHAGLIERYHGRASGRVRDFCLYGQTTGETDEYGLPVRYPWALEYRGRAVVLYGHTPVPARGMAEQHPVPGHGLCLRWPSDRLELSRTDYGVCLGRPCLPSPARPFPVVSRSGTCSAVGPGFGRRRPAASLTCWTSAMCRLTRHRDGLPAAGRRARGARRGRAGGDEPVRDRPALAAVPAADHEPRRHSPARDLLEHPDQAFDAYRADGVASVLCEEKHMGSRAVLLVCRSPDERRPGSACPGRPARSGPGPGGRSSPPALTASLIEQVRAAAEKAGLFEELGTSWLLLDAELLPWNVKAG